MPSVKNPNTPNKSRRIASRRKVQKQRSRAALPKNPRGTRLSTTMFPTSGPLAPLSGKKARKVGRGVGYAVRRREEAEAEAMKEVAEANAKEKAELEAKMDIDVEGGK